MLRRTAFLTVLLLAFLTGCSRDLRYEPAIGANERFDEFQTLSFAAVVNDSGQGTVVGTLINESQQTRTITGVEVTSDDAEITSRLADGPIRVEPDKWVRFARERVVTLASDDFPLGTFVRMTLRLDDGDEISFRMPVEPQEGPYSGIELTAPPDGSVAPE